MYIWHENQVWFFLGKDHIAVDNTGYLLLDYQEFFLKLRKKYKRCMHP